MERLAVIGGLIVAAVFALTALVPSGIAPLRVHVGAEHWDEAEPVAPELITTMAETVFAGDTVVLTDAAVRLDVILEDRADVAVSIDNAGPLATPLVTAADGSVRIDGRLQTGVSCRHDGGVVLVHGRGNVRREELPLVRIRAPRSLALEVAGANALTVGDAEALRLVFRGCGDATLGAVAGLLDLTAGGSGDVTVGRVGEAQITLAGAGDVDLAAIERRIKASINGSGSLTVAESRGEADLAVAGSGEARLQQSALTSLNANLSGSGDIEIEGDVTGAAVARVAGSGEIDVSGAVQTLNATVEGSGSVDVGAVRGAQARVVRGSGSVSVGEGPQPPQPPQAPQAPQPAQPAQPPQPPQP